MTPLEIKKLQVELMRVQSAKSDMELRIMERQEEIQRLEDNIKIQLAKEEEIQSQLKAGQVAK